MYHERIGPRITWRSCWSWDSALAVAGSATAASSSARPMNVYARGGKDRAVRKNAFCRSNLPTRWRAGAGIRQSHTSPSFASASAYDHGRHTLTDR